MLPGCANHPPLRLAHPRRARLCPVRRNNSLILQLVKLAQRPGKGRPGRGDNQGVAGGFYTARDRRYRQSDDKDCAANDGRNQAKRPHQKHIEDHRPRVGGAASRSLHRQPRHCQGTHTNHEFCFHLRSLSHNRADLSTVFRGQPAPSMPRFRGRGCNNIQQRRLFAKDLRAGCLPATAQAPLLPAGRVHPGGSGSPCFPAIVNMLAMGRQLW